jgi:hypothetical protein
MRGQQRQRQAGSALSPSLVSPLPALEAASTPAKPAKPNIPVWVCERERAVSGMTMVVHSMLKAAKISSARIPRFLSCGSVRYS